jgi:hypothetical protein
LRAMNFRDAQIGGSMAGGRAFRGAMIAAMLALPAAADEEGNPTEALQRIIAEQQRQLLAQQAQLDGQRKMLEQLQSQVAAIAKSDAESRAKAPSPPRVSPSPAAPLPWESSDAGAKSPITFTDPEPEGSALWSGSRVSQGGQFDSESPTGTDVTYFDPTKVINIPGTDTSIGLHGIMQFQMFHDTDGQNNNRFDTAGIPVDGSPSQSKFNVNPTQIRISSATGLPTGQLNTMFSMDLNGKLDQPDPRLRVAYAEYVDDDRGFGILAGQTYGTMLDLRAVPETLDFAGPAGLWQLREPLLRFSKSIGQNVLGEIALETPENANYLGDGVERHTRWPDLAIAATWIADEESEFLKHARVSALLRDLQAESVTGVTESALGWAVAASTKLALPFLGPKDNLKFNVHYGDGYGTQLKGGPAEGAFDMSGATFDTIEAFGFYGGVQHFWNDRWRSNFVLGHMDASNPEFVSGDALDNTTYGATSLIWRPFDQVDVGFEYLWGERENVDGNSGDASRFLFSTRVTF